MNNPSRYTDPSGHAPCEGKNYDDGPNCLKNKDSQLSLEVRNAKYQRDCAAGKNSACPGGIKGLVAFGAEAIVTAGLAETVILGGAGASAVAAAPAVGLRALAQCLVNATCRYGLAKLGLEGWAIRQLAQASLQNPESTELVIGSFPKVGETYTQMANRLDASYFNMPDDIWNIVKNNSDVTWKINEQALQMAVDAGKTVISQVDIGTITTTLTRTNLFKELWFFASQNYTTIGTNVLAPSNSTGFGFP